MKFNRSLQANPWGPLHFIVTALLLVGVVFFYLWRCSYGLDFFDEPYFLAPGFKNYALGDRIFSHEATNALRLFDQFNYFLVHPFLETSLVLLRRAAVLSYASILVFYVFVCFNQRLTFPAIITFSLCLMADLFLTPAWSYNWWCRNLFLIHGSLFLLAPTVVNRNVRRAVYFLSGTAIAAAAVSYVPVFLTVGVCWLLLLVESKSEKKAERLVPYLLGSSIFAVVQIFHFTQPGLFQDWILSLHASFAAQEPHLSGSRVWGKALTYVMLPLRERCTSLVLLLLITLNSKWGKRLRSVWPVLAVLFFIYIVGRIVYLTDGLRLTRAYIGASVAAGLFLLLFLRGRSEKNLTFVLLAAFSTQICMSLASSNEAVISYFMAPALLVPLMGMLAKQALSSPDREDSFRNRTGFLLMVFFVAVLTCASARFQFNQAYRDFPPGQMTGMVSASPYQGVKTSQRRAYLTDELAKAVKGKKFVFAWHRLPGIYLFPNVRSSTDSSIIDFDYNKEAARNSLIRMWKEQRYPELIIQAKTEAWTWGMANANVLGYKKDYPFTLFVECVKGPVVLEEPEVVVYDVQTAKMEACTKLAVAPREP